jgi:hypothetical protein
MTHPLRPIGLLAALALSSACSETVTNTLATAPPDAARADAPDATVDVPDAPDVPDTPDVPDAPDVACPMGLTRCGEECVDLATNAAQCGACGTACAAGETCAAGACQIECPLGQTPCEGVCQSLATDINNCGACGNGCPLGLSCVEGSCALLCLPGRTNCGGRCVDAMASNDHCGGCERPCATGTRCMAGACRGDPCGPADTAAGRCDGDAVVRCVSNEITREACGFGRVCVAATGDAAACAAPTGARRVTGRVTFQNRPATVRGVIASRYDAVEGVPVALLDASERVVLQGLTDADGAYNLAYDAPDGAMMRVRVALARTDSIYNFVVRDYTGATFSFTSPAFAAAAAATRDIAVTFEQNSGALSIYGAARRGFEFLRPFVTARPAALYITWQRNRATSTTNSSYFSGASSTMFINGSSADPDEFDPPVVAHEFGHYIQRWYSRSNNPGGPHDGSPADPNLAFGEGGASFFGSLITGSPYYIDAGVTRLRIAFDLGNVPLVRAYAASASLPIEQAVSEWLIGGTQYAMFRASPDAAAQTQRAMRVLTGYLRRTPTPDRGEPGVDLVDYLDGYLCVNDGAERSTIMNYLVTQRRFPYDFAFAGACR